METLELDEVVCVCLQVTEGQLRAAVEQRAVLNVRELMRATEAGTGCTACHDELESCLVRWSGSPPPPCLSEPAGEACAGRPA